jgi:hypothetical protein
LALSKNKKQKTKLKGKAVINVIGYLLCLAELITLGKHGDGSSSGILMKRQANMYMIQVFTVQCRGCGSISSQQKHQTWMKK